MEIKDLVGLSKPLGKLIDTVRQVVGNFSESYLIRKKTDAEANRIRELAGAVADGKKILGAGNIAYKNGELILISAESNEQQQLLTLSERALAREDYQRQLEQLNTEQITAYAAEELASSSADVSDEPVDPNWVASFFASAKNVSTEQMQMLWGKILAGEVKQPGTFSLRTLDLLKNLSKSEAEVFTKFANYTLVDQGKCFAIRYEDYIYEELGLTFLDFLLLEELGLIFSDSASIKITPMDNIEFQVIFTYGDMLIAIRKCDDSTPFSLPIIPFTQIGAQLASLIKINVSNEYLNKFTQLLLNKNIEVYHADIVSIKNGSIEYKNMRQIPK